MPRPAISRGAAALALCCAGLTVVIVAELGPGLNLMDQQDQAGRVPARLAVPTLTEETFALPPLEEFSEVVERPLFSTDRRPFEPPPPKAAAEQSRKTPRAPVPPPATESRRRRHYPAASLGPALGRETEHLRTRQAGHGGIRVGIGECGGGRCYTAQRGNKALDRTKGR